MTSLKEPNFLIFFAGCAAPQGVHSGWTLVPPGDRACRGPAVPGSPGEPRGRTPTPHPDPPRPAPPGTTRGGLGGVGGGGEGGVILTARSRLGEGGEGGAPPQNTPKKGGPKNGASAGNPPKTGSISRGSKNETKISWKNRGHGVTWAL
jgi:hypothetical protein